MSLTNRDVEDLKGLLNDTVKQFLGFSEPSVVSAALNCISTGYDKRKTVGKIFVEKMNNNKIKNIFQQAH